MKQQVRAVRLRGARLGVPELPEDTVHRDRVVRLIDAAVDAHPLTLVTGGAGSGKTYAVASWARRPSTPPVAWVALDAAEGEVGDLWTSILLAVDQALGRVARTEGRVRRVPNALDRGLGAMVDEEPFVLVLDDLQEIEGGEGLATLDRMPWPSLRHPVVLVSRHDPALRLNRLRVSGQLGEVRARDLAFDVTEARQLLQGRGLSLPPDALDHLMATTEGWAAGLRLATMTLEVSSAPAEAVRHFDGRHSLVGGYLFEEVLRSLGPDRSDFLLRTSAVDRVNAPLARALTGVEESGAVLDALVRENLFVSQLDGTGWYRYHPLLLQMVRARLHRQHPDLERTLHQIASGWFEGVGDGIAALGHAIDAGDLELAGEVALRAAAVAVFSVARPQLAVQLSRLDPADVHGRPEQELALALAAFCRRDAAACRRFLADAGPGLGSLPGARRVLASLVAHVLSAALARADGDAASLARHAAAAEELVTGLTPEDSRGWLAHRGALRALAGVGELWSGRPYRALELFVSARSEDDVSGDSYGLVYHLGLIATAEGRLGRYARSRISATAAVDAAEVAGRDGFTESGPAWLALAEARLAGGDLAGTSAAVIRAAASGVADRDPFAAAQLHGTTARQDLAAGRPESARRAVAELGRVLADHPAMATFRPELAALEMEVLLAAGAEQQAEETWQAQAPAAGSAAAPDLALARARLLLATGRAGLVREAVGDLLEDPAARGASAWLWVALAEDRLRHDAGAADAMARALTLAEGERVVLPFLGPHDRLGEMLDRHLALVGTHRPFVEDVLERRVGHPAESRSGPEVMTALTERERAVLAYLPTLSTNAEIAAQLNISVNTVKQHLKSINRKLAVGSRRDAVRAARRRGLLTASSP